MACLIYPDTPTKKYGKGFYITEADANKYWAEHAANRHYLEMLSRKANFQDRCQIEKELLICARKLDYWQKHKNWDGKKAEKIISTLRRKGL